MKSEVSRRRSVSEKEVPSVLLRRTNRVGVVICPAMDSPFQSRRSADVTASPVFQHCWSTEVMAGEKDAARSVLSKPVTRKSSGTLKPAAFAAWHTPMAI